MTSRNQILADVRKALGRQPGQAPAPPTTVRIRIPEISMEQRIAMFRERLEVLGGKVYRAANADEAEKHVAEITGGQDAVTTQEFTDEASLREACASAPFGITVADYGLAETGSIVTIASTEARLVSLLPPAHIALLPLSRLLTGLDEFYTKVPLPAIHSASTVFITGPSRSADIEMILVRGVHGPRVIHVIVIEEL